MPIIFYSKNEDFIQMMKNKGYKAYNDDIKNYKSNKKTFYVSPANSLGYMSGGYDYALTQIMPGIDVKLREKIKKSPFKTFSNKHYLPIGSSIIVKHSHNEYLISAPTMLIPQNVSETNNAYYATKSALHNILLYDDYDLNKINIVFTSLCCGYGGMNIIESANQMARAICEHSKIYNTTMSYNNGVLYNEPNLHEQPRIFDNNEWFTENDD